MERSTTAVVKANALPPRGHTYDTFPTNNTRSGNKLCVLLLLFVPVDLVKAASVLFRLNNSTRSRNWPLFLCYDSVIGAQLVFYLHKSDKEPQSDFDLNHSDALQLWGCRWRTSVIWQQCAFLQTHRQTLRCAQFQQFHICTLFLLSATIKLVG